MLGGPLLLKMATFFFTFALLLLSKKSNTLCLRRRHTQVRVRLLAVSVVALSETRHARMCWRKCDDKEDEEHILLQADFYRSDDYDKSSRIVLSYTLLIKNIMV